MPVHLNQIGAELFEDIEGSLQVRGEELEVISRKGVDGVVVRKTGRRVESFTIQTIHYVLDNQAARDALLTYNAMRGQDPVPIFHRSVYRGNYLVLKVREVTAQVCINAIGTIIPNAQVRQVCEWTLQG